MGDGTRERVLRLCVSLRPRLTYIWTRLVKLVTFQTHGSPSTFTVMQSQRLRCCPRGNHCRLTRPQAKGA